MVYGLIDRKSHSFYTYMRPVFDGLGQAQKGYNWLITDCECYPKDNDTAQLLEQEYCWLSGEELSGIIAREDFQWIWGVLCGFEPGIALEEVLKYPLPSAQEYTGYYHNPVDVQHPLATVEIIPSDSSWITLVSKDKTIIDRYLSRYPKAEDLSAYNQR